MGVAGRGSGGDKETKGDRDRVGQRERERL